jgi:hypothetical protein
MWGFKGGRAGMKSFLVRGGFEHSGSVWRGPWRINDCARSSREEGVVGKLRGDGFGVGRRMGVWMMSVRWVVDG